MSQSYSVWHPFPEDLNVVRDLLWQQLQSAVGHASHPWRWGQLATIHRSAPSVRTVVLRHVNPLVRTLSTHTDLRSPKVAQIRRHKEIQWLFFDSEARVQLLASGQATVHVGDALAVSAWNAAPEATLRVYLAPAAPGQKSGRPSRNLPEWAQTRIPTRKELEAGRSHFAVVRTVIHRFDVLGIEREGSLRAAFEWDGTQWQADWIEP